MAKVCQLFSGSSGNSILVSSSGHNYLVDIGVSAKKCENGLNQIGIEPDSIEGIFVTHEHGDHAKGVRRKPNIQHLRMLVVSRALACVKKAIT